MRNTKKWMALLLSAAMIMQSTPASLQAASKPKLNKTKLTLQVGNKAGLRVKGSRIKKCVYRSKNKKIATVNEKGMVKARKKGNTKICVTVTYREGKNTLKKKLWCKVIVKAQSKADTTKVSPETFVTVKPGVSNVPSQTVTSQSPVDVSPSGGTTAVPGMTASAAPEIPEVTAGMEPTAKATFQPVLSEKTSEPDQTKHPEISKAPDTTQKPNVSQKPDTTEKPNVSAKPDTTKKPNVFAMSGAYGKKDGSVIVPLQLTGDVLLSGFDIIIKYDADALALESVFNEDGGIVYNSEKPGEVRIERSWSLVQDEAPADTYDRSPEAMERLKKSLEERWAFGEAGLETGMVRFMKQILKQAGQE